MGKELAAAKAGRAFDGAAGRLVDGTMEAMLERGRFDEAR